MVAAAGLSVTTGRAASPSSSFVGQPGSPQSRRRLSSLTHSPFSSSSSRSLDTDAIVRPPISDHVVLLLQQWLTIIKFPRTLSCLLDEYSRELKHPPPEMDQWFTLTQQLHSVAVPGDSNTALLERIVSQTVAQSRQIHKSDKQPLTTLVVTKRPLTAGSNLKFTSKRSLPVASSHHNKSAPCLSTPPALLVRPQSAIVVAGSKNTSDLVAARHGAKLGRLDEDREHTTNQTTSPAKPELVSNRRTLSRPISAAPGSLTPHRDSQSVLSTSPTNVVKSRSSRVLLAQTSSSRLLLDQLAANASSQMNRKNAEVKDQSEGGTNADKDKETEPAEELEEMSEERLTEQFGGFSKGNIKKLRRVLAKSSAHSQELQRTRKAMEKIQLKAQQQHQRSSMATQQTELLSSTMDMLIKEPCSLCRYVFFKKSLTTKVSYKSVCDLRASWAAKKRKAATGKPGSDPRLELQESPMTGNDDNDDGDLEMNQQQTLESAQQISHLYDEVPVCAFCTQLVLDYPSYRPSSPEQKLRREENRRLAVERHKARELERQHDRLKCDPLDFHSYELNSDDDGSETEETVEIDSDGRFHVTRRHRPRRRTQRIPAQLGLVSKRLHYDHLRSGSVHALNKKEWDVLNDHQ